MYIPNEGVLEVSPVDNSTNIDTCNTGTIEHYCLKSLVMERNRHELDPEPADHELRGLPELFVILSSPMSSVITH